MNKEKDQSGAIHTYPENQSKRITPSKDEGEAQVKPGRLSHKTESPTETLSTTRPRRKRVRQSDNTPLLEKLKTIEKECFITPVVITVTIDSR